MDFIIKVDRVKNVEEAIALQDLGVKLIGVSLGDQDSFNDDRMLTEEKVFLIYKSLESSKLVGDISGISRKNQASNTSENLNFDYIQINKSELREEIDQTADNQKKGVIYAPICLSYDEDPNWPFESLEKEAYSYFQLDLLGDIEDSWSFLTTKAPEYPDELQVEDIDELSKEYPLFLTTNFSIDNISEILSHFPHICGISFVLGKSPYRNDIHCFDFSEVVKILESLKKK